MGYSLQQNQKMQQVRMPHLDRNAQFEYINKKCGEFIHQGQPIIFVDTKRKELVENFKDAGEEYNRKKAPPYIMEHDFPIKEIRKIAPYGIYNINQKEVFVNLGVPPGTAEFAVESIWRWWQTLGKNTYPDALKLYINSNNSSGNASKADLWKKQLQEFANITGLDLHISHYPIGTSKWNKIEHKMFCFRNSHWRGMSLISVEAIVELVSNNAAPKSKVPKIVCVKDENKYEFGINVTDKELAELNITRDAFHGDWNYVISPLG
jgi:hypothetical protein